MCSVFLHIEIGDEPHPLTAPAVNHAAQAKVQKVLLEVMRAKVEHLEAALQRRDETECHPLPATGSVVIGADPPI